MLPRVTSYKEVMIMVLDRRDTELLRLAGKYRWLPYKGINKYGFDDIEDEIGKLASLGLLGISRDREYLRLCAEGYAVLRSAGYNYSPGSKRAFAGSPALRRRLQTADIMLTCLRAGIDTLQVDASALRNQLVFYPAFDIRPAMMNCTSCSAFGHWGDTIYMIQCVNPQSQGMYRVNEMAVFHNLAGVYGSGYEEPEAMLFAGDSYASVYKQLTNSTPSARHGIRGFVDFREVYKKSNIPIHIVACNENGARQLAVMCQPDYRAKIAKAAYGQLWKKRDEKILAADGCVDGAPLVIAVDMDIRRIQTVVNAAKALGRPAVKVAAFEEQILEVLCRLYPNGTPGNIVSLLKIEDAVLDAAFGGILLYNMDRSPAYSDKGGALFA